MASALVISVLMSAWSMAMKTVLMTMQSVMKRSTKASIMKSSTRRANPYQEGKHSQSKSSRRQRAFILSLQLGGFEEILDKPESASTASCNFSVIEYPERV